MASDFVEECRREWRRLCVPDPVANEMAADLRADLEEAEAEGASPEAVLGSEAFDPRSFAALWAQERGVVGSLPAQVDPRFPRPSRLLVGTGLSALVVFIGVVLASAREGGSVAAEVQPAFSFPQSPLGLPEGSVVHSHAAVFPTIGLLFVLVGVVGAIAALVRWSPWTIRLDQRRDRYTGL